MKTPSNALPPKGYSDIKNLHSAPKRALLRGVFVFAFWICVWELISLAVGIELLVPSPITVAKTWVGLASERFFWVSTLLTLWRVAVGFVAGTLIGAAFAFLTRYFTLAKTLFEPIIRIIRAVPVASFIILALVWIQTEALPSFISGAMAMPMVWQSVSTSLENDIDPLLLEMSRVYKVPRRRVFFGIVLPSVYPAFLSGSLNALGFAWKSGVAAEVICQPALSIGKQLQNAKIFLETPEVFAWTLTVCVLSLSLEKILRFVSKKFTRRSS